MLSWTLTNTGCHCVWWVKSGVRRAGTDNALKIADRFAPRQFLSTDFEDGDSSYVVVDIVGGKSNLKSDTFTFRPSYTNGATCTYTVTGPDKDPKLTFSSKAGCLTCSSG